MSNRILITGATGQLGPYLVRHLRDIDVELTLWARRVHEPVLSVPVESVDLLDQDAVRRNFDRATPGVLIHCAALSSIVGCYKDDEFAGALNHEATKQLATLAGVNQIRMIYTSTDLVFDGERDDEQGGYGENDAPNPLSIYGKTKLAGESSVLELGDGASGGSGVVIRLPILFGPTLLGKPRSIGGMLAALRGGRRVTLFDDEWRTPLAVDVAAEAISLAALTGLRAGEDSNQSAVSGLFHVAGCDRLTRYEMGTTVAEMMGLDAGLIDATSRLSIDVPEPRPCDTSLCAARWYKAFDQCPQPTFRESIQRLFVDSGR